MVQSTTKSGKIKISASMQNPGQSRPLEGILEFESVANDQKEVFSQKELSLSGQSRSVVNLSTNKSDLEGGMTIVYGSRPSGFDLKKPLSNQY